MSKQRRSTMPRINPLSPALDFTPRPNAFITLVDVQLRAPAIFQVYLLLVADRYRPGYSIRLTARQSDSIGHLLEDANAGALEFGEAEAVSDAFHEAVNAEAAGGVRDHPWFVVLDRLCAGMYKTVCYPNPEVVDLQNKLVGDKYPNPLKEPDSRE